MALETFTTAKWPKLAFYGRFEQIALGSVMLLLAVITVFAIIFAAIKLFADLALGEAFLDKAAMQDTFGLILTIVILLEFNHSIYVGLTRRLGVVQVRMIVLIAILVIARKLMLRDFETLDYQALLGFGGLLLALGRALLADCRRRPAVRARGRRSARSLIAVIGGNALAVGRARRLAPCPRALEQRKNLQWRDWRRRTSFASMVGNAQPWASRCALLPTLRALQ